MSRLVRFVLALLLAIVTVAGVAAILGVRVADVEHTTFAPVTPGRPDPELAQTETRREVSLQDREQWVYPVATFVGVFGLGFAQLVLTHRPGVRRASAGAGERYPNSAAPID